MVAAGHGTRGAPALPSGPTHRYPSKPGRYEDASIADAVRRRGQVVPRIARNERSALVIGDRVTAMVHDRVAAIAAAITKLASTEGMPVALDHVGRACHQLLDVDGVSMCVAGELGIADPVYATIGLADRAIELEITVGVGPGVQVMDVGDAVLVGSLATRGSRRRWPVLVPLLAELGVQAVFAFPMAAGDVSIGTLQLYRARPGALTASEVTDAQLFADYALALLVSSEQSHQDLDVVLASPLTEQWDRVHQAAGLVAARLNIELWQAYMRLRTHAFATQRPLRKIAEDALAGRVQFDR